MESMMDEVVSDFFERNYKKYNLTKGKEDHSLISVMKQLIPLAEDGYKAAVRSGHAHQEFLQEDRPQTEDYCHCNNEKDKYRSSLQKAIREAVCFQDQYKISQMILNDEQKQKEKLRKGFEIERKHNKDKSPF